MQVVAMTDLISEMRPPLAPPGRPQCALFLTIAEQFDATVCLARANLLTHATVHVRAMAEATADMYMLGTADDHVRRMRYEQVSGEKAFYERLLASHGPTQAEHQLVADRLEACRDRHGPLHAEFKKKRLFEADKFTAAGLPEFIPLYPLLCSFSHNDLTALSLRHQSSGPGMIFRAGVSDEIAYLILHTAQHAMVRSTERIGSVAHFPDGHFELHFGVMKKLYEQLVDLRSTDDAGRPA